MAAMICLDAGHYGKYNRSPANLAYYESEVMWKLHLLLEKHLKQFGFEVIKTRDNQTDDRTLYDRGAVSGGCVLFLSLHSNAVGSSVNDSVDYPVAYAAISGRADRIATLLTECVARVMETKQSARIEHRKGSSGADYYGVIRGAAAVGTPGLILEHSFHTNTRSTNWLLNDSNLDKLAKAEAEVIANYFGLTADIPVSDPVGEKWYRVRKTWTDAASQIGAFESLENAKNACREGYTVYDWNGNAVYSKDDTSVSFIVRVSIDNLNIRKGPGTDYAATGEKTGRGTFTIVEVQPGSGSDAGWGRLKSGIGWISLDYTERI